MWSAPERHHDSRSRLMEGLVGLSALAGCGGSDGPTNGSGSSNQVASVVVSPNTLAMYVGESRPLKATVKNEEGAALSGHTVEWATGDPAIVTVSSSGVVTAVALGSASITATSEGKSGNATASVAGTVAFASVAAGGAHTCALTATGEAYCWGRGESGQLGVPAPTTRCPADGGPVACSRVPIAVSAGLVFSRIAGGGAHTCGLTADGTGYCWGNNGYGQLGDNSTTDRFTPVPVATSLKFTAIDGGVWHTCALTAAGTVHCWGRNDLGQLGDGTALLRLTPVAVIGGVTFKSIGAGGFDIGHTCGLASDGGAWCWGANDKGQRGDGTQDGAAIPHSAPAPVSGGILFTSLSAGLGGHNCALSTQGPAYCWGANEFGAVGDGSDQTHTFPVAVGGGLTFVQLAAGGFIGHTCGVAEAGAAYCWGENSVGQVGDGSSSDRYAPAPVSGGLVFTTMDAGFRHTCGVTTSGILYCWGGNGAGQLGNNVDNPPWSYVPVKVVGQP